MKTKSLKIQLLILFFIAFINILYYCFPATFGDNALGITDTDISGGIISYAVSSLLAFVSYFSGVWTVGAFIVTTLVYSLFLNKRESSKDIFVPMVIFFMTGGIAYLVFPEFVGSGVYYLSDEYLSVYSIAFSTLLFMGLVFYLVFQGAFIQTMTSLADNLSLVGKRVIARMMKKMNGAYLEFKNKKRLQISDGKNEAKTSKLKLPTLKKNVFTREKVEENNLSEPVKKTSISIEEPIVSEVQIVEAKEEVSRVQVVEEMELASEGDINSNDVTDEAVSKIYNERRESPKVNYQTNDLINKITDKVERVQIEGPDRDYYEQISKAIEDKLAEFNINTKIVHIRKGPVVDTFELELGEGVKVSKVINLNDDISMALRGTPIRLVYPLKGKTTVGIEVPRNKREFIYLDEILNSEVFNSSKMRLPIAMGRDVFGDVSVVDLAGMPHMLVAGATGAGKSVFVNTLLVSLLVRKSPREMKLLLIDPKQLELALYSNLPHLCLPVITEAKNAGVALLWAVEEMDRRYSILKNMGVRNIEDFNKKIKTCDLKLLSKINEFYSDEDSEGYELPYIVIIIDEFADLILTKYGKEIETSVNRLAAKARAAGIHLVLATQRPSTDIITGVIKANFPTRVAFRVTTATDSRVVLDQNGAEKLLGKGDMLYKFGVNLDRLHSAYIDEEEITGLVDALEAMPGSYSSAAMEFLENGGQADDDIPSGSFTGSTGSSKDELYDEAVRVVLEQGSASASMLQRRLRVGYNRAANLVEEMERNGIVGPQEGSKPRKVLSGSGE